jgi:hypothetical protein
MYAPNPNSRNIPVVFQGPNKLFLQTERDSILFEVINPITSQILGEFETQAEITTQLYCHSKLVPTSRGNSNGRRGVKPWQSWFLNAILFGTQGLEDTVGRHLSNYGMYLQDPLGCKRCVPYRNPHVISPESDDVTMTDSFDRPLGNLEIERLELGPDLLAQLMEDELSLTETEAPDIVKTALFPYLYTSPSPLL